MVCLAISLAYPSEKKGVFYSFKLFQPALTALVGGGGGGSAPCGVRTELSVYG